MEHNRNQPNLKNLMPHSHRNLFPFQHKLIHIENTFNETFFKLLNILSIFFYTDLENKNHSDSNQTISLGKFIL